jgi:hypothetical protein
VLRISQKADVEAASQDAVQKLLASLVQQAAVRDLEAAAIDVD